MSKEENRPESNDPRPGSAHLAYMTLKPEENTFRSARGEGKCFKYLPSLKCSKMTYRRTQGGKDSSLSVKLATKVTP